MEQLSGLDAAFISQDGRRTPMHITAVLLYDAGENGEHSLSLARLKELVAARLTGIPLISRKLHDVTRGMDTPYWIDGKEPDWDRHITEYTLPDGANWATLHTLLDKLHGRKMDLALPVWEIKLLQGLDALPGLPAHAYAVVLKVHHAAIDGISMAGIINSLHQAGEKPSPGRHKPTRTPGQWEVWQRTQINTLGRQMKLAETVQKLWPSIRAARTAGRDQTDLPATHKNRSHFNARVSERRSTGSMLVPMDEVRAIKRAVRRVTYNDIAMACVAGALREYLLTRNKLPRASLVAGVPMNLRTADNDRPGGNKIATMAVGLATHLEDPVERLRLIHRYAVAGKKQINAFGSGTVMDISDSLAPAVLSEGIRAMAWASELADAPVPFHTMISNVPGPSDPVYLEGARLVVPVGLGPIRDNMGLFHIVSSSDSTLSIAFSACRKLLPCAATYRQCLANSMQALSDSALGRANE